MNTANLFKRLRNNKGSLLVISFFVIIVFLALGGALMILATNEARTSERQRLQAIALNIAEAGIERAIATLKADFVNDTTSPSWSDGDINGYAIGPNTGAFYPIPYTGTTLNGGIYAVSLKNVSSSREMWIQSIGRIQDAAVTLRAYVRVANASPWNNVIFAGTGAAGAMINGNVNIAGSVIVLGEDLNPGDLAINLGGDATLVSNNYSGLEAGLRAKVPALPTTVFGGETVQTLNGTLRVKRGIVALSGSAEVGQTNATGNTIKETVDGVWVTEGFGGTGGANNVHSDNGTANPYDLGETVRFPLLSDPAPEDPTRTIQQYFRDNALILTTELSSINPGSSFNYSNAKGSITMDGAGNMTISGRVYVDGNNILKISKSKVTTINYTGSGTILVTGNAEINDVDLVTAGNNSFPTNIMGLMTPGRITFNGSQINAMGMFYAQDRIISTKQTDVLGTFMSNYFDMGTNVPSIFQVPTAVDHLPVGLIGASSGWIVSVVSWQKV